MPLRAAVISSAISWPMPLAGAREAVVFSDPQVLNLLLWGFVVALFALGYIAGRLR